MGLGHDRPEGIQQHCILRRPTSSPTPSRAPDLAPCGKGQMLMASPGRQREKGGQVAIFSAGPAGRGRGRLRADVRRTADAGRAPTCAGPFAPELGFPPRGVLARAARGGRRQGGPIEPPVAVSVATKPAGLAGAARPEWPRRPRHRRQPPRRHRPRLALRTVLLRDAGHPRGAQRSQARPAADADASGARAEPRRLRVRPCARLSRLRARGRAEPAVTAAAVAAPRGAPVPVSVSIICCCCGGGEDGPGSGGGGGNGKGGTGGTAGPAATSGTGTIGGPGWGPGEPVWGPPDECGWQVWGEPFTLPVTRPTGPPGTPARSIPAPIRTRFCRTGTCWSAASASARLDLLNGMSPATSSSTSPTARRVRAAGAGLARDAQLRRRAAAPPTTAPRRRSCRCAWSPSCRCRRSARIMARVLGLYFVDTEADPDEEYQYCIVGRLGAAGPAARCAALAARRPGRSPAGRRTSTG